MCNYRACRAPFVAEWYQFFLKTETPYFREIQHFIYSFHMPLFFFLSGYLYAAKNKLNWLNYNIKRFKRLIIPFFTVGFLTITTARYYFCPVKPDLLTLTKNFFTLQDIKYLWFLPALFVTSLIYTALMSTILRKHLFITLFITVIFWQYRYWAEHRLLQQAFEYITYMHLGYIFATKNITFSSKVIPYLILGLMLNKLFYDLSLKIRFLYKACYLLILFYMLAHLLTKKLPQLTLHNPIRFISANMFMIYILSDPLMLTILSIINNYGLSCLNIFLLLGAGTLIVASLLVKIYLAVKNKFISVYAHPSQITSPSIS